MAKFKMGVLVDSADVITARLADGSGSSNQLTKADNGKLVKLKGDSQFGLCAAGNEIEGVVVNADEMAPQDGFNLGGVQPEGRFQAVCDGLQATPGTGTIAVGDYVVAGTVVARGTALSEVGPRVCKATAAATGIVFKWRVVSLGNAGAVGDTAIVEFVG